MLQRPCTKQCGASVIQGNKLPELLQGMRDTDTRALASKLAKQQRKAILLQKVQNILQPVPRSCRSSARDTAVGTVSLTHT